MGIFRDWHNSRNAKKMLTRPGFSKAQIMALKQKQQVGEDITKDIEEIQSEARRSLKDNGLALDILTPEIGKHISWEDVLLMVFRVRDFDKNGTLITQSGEVKARSATQPYGYLLVESPTLTQAVGLPIIHRDDFLLASSVFDDPSVSIAVTSPLQELLVTYAPKSHKKGYVTSLHHALHYAIVPRGTLERYYSDDKKGNRRMTLPEPELIFGPLKYDGEIQVVTNPTPDL